MWEGMSDKNPYDPPKAEIPPGSGAGGLDDELKAPNGKGRVLFSPKAIYLAAIVGGPLGAGYGMLRYCIRLGNLSVPIVIFLPVLFLFMAWASGILSIFSGNVMGFLLWAGSIAVTCVLYEWTAGKKYDAYVSNRGLKKDAGPGVLIAVGLISFFLLLVLINVRGNT